MPFLSRVRAVRPSPAPTPLDVLRPSRLRSFDWLEGATGVRLVVRARTGRRTVEVSGDVDAGSAEVIERALSDAVDRSPARVELDLGGVGFIDPVGVAMIARARRRAERLRVALDVTPGGPGPAGPAAPDERPPSRMRIDGSACSGGRVRAGRSRRPFGARPAPTEDRPCS